MWDNFQMKRKEILRKIKLNAHKIEHEIALDIMDVHNEIRSDHSKRRRELYFLTAEIGRVVLPYMEKDILFLKS